MTQVKTGDTVHIHYTGTLNDGTTFDSSEGREPLTFEVGSGQIIPGLDSAIPGMTVGDKKTVNVACDDAYGQMNPAMRQDVPRADIPAEIPLEVGSRLQHRTGKDRRSCLISSEFSNSKRRVPRVGVRRFSFQAAGMAGEAVAFRLGRFEFGQVIRIRMCREQQMRFLRW